MASQVAHIVYAGKYLEKYPMENSDEFLLGVCFPDIRRIDSKIKRSDTHIILSDLNANLSYLKSFQAGWKFHLYCDMRREEILNNLHFYDLPIAGDYWGLPAKHLEDEVVYESFNDWEKVIKIFNKPPKVEIPHFVSRETFEIWYAILAKYFEKKPDSESIRIFIKKQPGLVKVADDIVKTMDKLRKNSKIVEILAKIKKEIVNGV